MNIAFKNASLSIHIFALIFLFHSPVSAQSDELVFESDLYAAACCTELEENVQVIHKLYTPDTVVNTHSCQSDRFGYKAVSPGTAITKVRLKAPQGGNNSPMEIAEFDSGTV